MDVSRLKTDFGGRITFWGGLSTQRTLPYGSPEDVAKEARRLKKEMSQGGGYIFAPAQELQADVPVENFTALVAAAKE
jgi:uroporphyrinogen decarboxylase